MNAPALWAGEETLVPGALRGYRSWKVKNKALHSTGVVNRWDGPELTARCLSSKTIGGQAGCDCDLCLSNDHQPPVRDCSCGVYGWYDPADSRLVEGDVFGVVEITGRAVMASHGFRAERARIVALAITSIDPYRGIRHSSFTIGDYDPPPSGSDLHDIARWAKTEGIPVFTSRDALLDAYPPQDVSSLVEHECNSECQAHSEHGKSGLSISQQYMQALYGPWLTSTTHSTGANSITFPIVSREPEPPKCKLRRAHLALFAFALVGLACGLISAVDRGLTATNIVCSLTNGGLVGYWGNHIRQMHWPLRSKKTATNLDYALSDDDAEDEAT